MLFYYCPCYRGGDESGSTEIDTDATQDTENSEDKKPLSKKGRRRHKPKKSSTGDISYPFYFYHGTSNIGLYSKNAQYNKIQYPH